MVLNAIIRQLGRVPSFRCADGDPCRPLRQKYDQSYDERGNDCGGQRAAQSETAIVYGFVQKIADRRAEGAR